MSPAMEKAIESVIRERTRQIGKWGDPCHNSSLEWNAILGEEAGEVAKEVLTERFGFASAGGHGNLREELTHVAAVAVAWIEDIDQEAETR